MRKHLLVMVGAAVLAVAAPSVASAATELMNPLPSNDLRIIIGNLVRAMLGLSGAVAFLMFVYGGFQWLTSGGSPDKIKAGKSTLTWAAIGLVVIFTSYTLVSTLITALVQGEI